MHVRGHKLKMPSFASRALKRRAP